MNQEVLSEAGYVRRCTDISRLSDCVPGQEFDSVLIQVSSSVETDCNGRAAAFFTDTSGKLLVVEAAKGCPCQLPCGVGHAIFAAHSLCYQQYDHKLGVHSAKATDCTQFESRPKMPHVARCWGEYSAYAVNSYVQRGARHAFSHLSTERKPLKH